MEDQIVKKKARNKQSHLEAPQKATSDEDKRIEFLVEKSKSMLQEQLISYEASKKRAEVLILILSAILPIFTGYLVREKTFYCIDITSAVGIIAVIFFSLSLNTILQVLRSKKLEIGIGFSKFDELLKLSFRDIQLLEIGANRTAHNAVKETVKWQHIKIGYAIRHIIIGSILASVYFILSNIDA
jgi:hypothetical protein